MWGWGAIITTGVYIRTSHTKGIISSFKTLDLRAFQKSSLKAWKKLASKYMKDKLKKTEDHSLWRATKQNPEQLEPSTF
jgi:hypothetical protein